MTEQTLAQRLAAAILANGPISLAKYMAAANAHYYGSRDPLGVVGDFTTAPEISQMFGELVGLWLADQWLRAGRPAVHYCELGPGRGSLARDALRAMATVGLTPLVHFVETSPLLRAKQAELVASANWHDTVASLPKTGPLMIIANEFFDALPIQQIERSDLGWHQRMVGFEEGRFSLRSGKLVPAEVVPPTLADAASGSVIETCPEAVDIARQIAQRIGEQGGVMLVIDYGYQGPALGETLQAVSAHSYADPLEDPGERDLTAHVDFTNLAAMGELCGIAVHGLVSQGDWLNSLGLAERAQTLCEAHPESAEDIHAASLRLSTDLGMGRLFQVLAFSSGDWPIPAGFVKD